MSGKMSDQKRPLTQLVITPSYPPVDSSVTLINIKVIEALERLGVRSVVLTVTPEDVDYTITASLERIFRSDRTVYRIRAFEKGGRLLTAARKALEKTPVHYLPDSHYVWTVNAIRALPAIFRREKIDIIHSVSAPYASHMVGYRANAMTGKPWVCNLVDFWAAQPAEHFSRYRRLNYWLQDRCFAKAGKVVASTREILDLTAGRYKEPVRSRFECVTPSYDPCNYPKEYKRHFDRYVFTFLGVFYQNKREPYTLLKALRLLKDKSPGTYRKLEFNLVGIDPGKWQRVVDEHGVGDAVRLRARVDYADSVRRMKESAVLLHIGYMSGKFPQDIHIPGKIYEYFGAERLILGLTTPDGPVAELVRSAGGTVADYRDPEAIGKAIRDITERYKPSDLYRWKARESVGAYSVDRIAARYLNIFNEMPTFGASKRR